MDRFGPMMVWSASWKGLSNRDPDGSISPNWPARITSLVLPALAMALVVITKTRLSNDAAGAIVTAGALVAGALLSAFGLLAAWRERLTDREGQYPIHDRPARDMIDEGVAHILEAVRESVVVAALGVVLWVLPESDHGKVWLVAGIIVSTALLGLAVHVAVLFGFLTNQLYAGYDLRNRIRPRLSGREKVLKPERRSSQRPSIRP